MAAWFSDKTASLFALLFYFIILVPAILNYQYPPTPPAPGVEARGLNLSQALIDLQFITARPHAFDSRANDAVRSYILSRLEQIQSETHSLIIDNDTLSNVTFYGGDGIFRYFEDNNILVSIKGRDPELKAVLLSAHFDSVPTSYGATDNGMGVATVLQLVSYFAYNRPLRSVMFNINNGEEDDLQGSHAFLNHPWSKDVAFFLNFEGAGAGGLPIVFRTSSHQVTQALKASSHPHGSTLCTDAFSLGLIRSRTDYSIYTAAGMSGLDFAFYHRRSYYHTLRDTISNLDGHGSLWTLMDSSLSMSIALSQIEPSDTHLKDHQPSLHFDIFAQTLALFTSKQFYIVNLSLLVIGASFYVLRGVYATRSLLPQVYSKETIYFPVISIFSVILSVGLCFAYIFVNPYIIHSSRYLVVFSFWILVFVSFHIPLSYLSKHAQNLHEIILYEINLFWWLVLLLNTIVLVRQGLGGLYFITFLYGTSLLALVLPLEFQEVAEDNIGTNSGLQSETTPLLRRTEQHQIPRMNYDSRWLWSLRVLLCVPIPVCLITQIEIILLNALSQTLPDGTPATFVYGIIALVNFLLVLPIVPFMVTIPRKVSFALLLLFIIISGVNLLSRPFLESSPLKVLFHQSVNLTGNTNTVHLTGLNDYIQEVAHQIPSAFYQPVSCGPNGRGLTICNWSSMATITEDMVSVKTVVLGPGEATLKVRGKDTRFCRIRFDSPVVSFRVHGTTGELLQTKFSLPRDGIRELRLTSRVRAKEFLVDVSWPKNETLRGRASCSWSDSEDWSTRIPAFQEVLTFLPSWSLVSSVKEGLVEASLEFAI